MSDCWLKQFWPHECEGRYDRAHIGLSQQFLSQQGLHGLTCDPRLYRYCCRASHHRLDNGFIRLSRSDLPASVEAFAQEHDLLWRLDRDYGPKASAQEPIL